MHVAPIYPKLVRGGEFRVLTRLQARINAKDMGNGVYLTYCQRHHAYFLDKKHTHDDLRCPLCNEEWLLKHGF